MSEDKQIRKQQLFLYSEDKNNFVWRNVFNQDEVYNNGMIRELLKQDWFISNFSDTSCKSDGNTRYRFSVLLEKY